MSAPSQITTSIYVILDIVHWKIIPFYEANQNENPYARWRKGI
jgi:hypothetical protein